jgi:predicted transcriptional regulator
MRTTSVSRSVRIPAELDARLVAEAERLDRSVSWLIVRALDGTIGGASQKVATQRAKAAEEPQKWTDDSLAEVPYEPPVKSSKERMAVKATIVPQTPSEKLLTKGLKPMVYCTVCDRSSLSTKWGCPEHGYGKVKPYGERGL